MNTIPRSELIENLIKIQARLCSYGTVHGDGHTCDCKFGANTVGSLASESTGCPEIRQVLEDLGVPFVKEPSNAT